MTDFADDYATPIANAVQLMIDGCPTKIEGRDGDSDGHAFSEVVRMFLHHLEPQEQKSFWKGLKAEHEEEFATKVSK